MSTVKSFSVGDGDMFYIRHNTDNFTTIDCCLNKKEGVKDHILTEIAAMSKDKGIQRFISTHPDDDHISGLSDYEVKFPICNFYRVDNSATKSDKTDDFDCYCKLRDDNEHNFSLEKDCKRKWMNLSDDVRDHSGLHCLWPIVNNMKYKEALKASKDGGSPNNISPAIEYLVSSFSFLWMGDMESDMQNEFCENSVVSHTNVVFAPHHGRKSGSIPQSLLDKLTPDLIIVGEAPSKDLDYYSNYNTITQNSAGDIRFEIGETYIDIYVSSGTYKKTDGMVNNVKAVRTLDTMYYLGSIKN